MTRPIAIAVVEQEGRYLIGQRPEGVPLAGLWEFPGGKIEPGEAPSAAAVRECREEAGLAVDPGEELLVQIQEYPHGSVELHFVACRLADESSPAVPASPFRWVHRQDLAQYEFPSGNRGLLAMIAAVQQTSE